MSRPGSSYADVELVSLVDGDTDALRDFVQRELKGLAADESTAERLRETALAYLVAGDLTGAARAMSVHKNTVRYRLQQIESALAHPIDQRRTQVELALRCVAAYGAKAFA